MLKTSKAIVFFVLLMTFSQEAIVSGFIVTRENLIKNSSAILLVNNLQKEKVLIVDSKESFSVLEVEVAKVLKPDSKKQLKVGDKIFLADFHSKETLEMLEKGLSISAAHYTGSANRQTDKNYVVYLGDKKTAESGESFWRVSSNGAYDKLEVYEQAASEQ